MKSPFAFAALMTATMYVTTASVAVLTTSCERKPKTIGDKVDDALDARPNEKLKDAGENIKDAARDATN